MTAVAPVGSCVRGVLQLGGVAQVEEQEEEEQGPYSPNGFNADAADLLLNDVERFERIARLSENH